MTLETYKPKFDSNIELPHLEIYNLFIATQITNPEFSHLFHNEKGIDAEGNFVDAKRGVGAPSIVTANAFFQRQWAMLKGKEVNSAQFLKNLGLLDKFTKNDNGRYELREKLNPEDEDNTAAAV